LSEAACSVIAEVQNFVRHLDGDELAQRVVVVLPVFKLPDERLGSSSKLGHRYVPPTALMLLGINNIT